MSVRGTFFNSIDLAITNQYDKGDKMYISTEFLDVCVTTFPGSVISEMQKLRGSSFFSKCSKLNLNFKTSAKNAENWYR